MPVAHLGVCRIGRPLEYIAGAAAAGALEGRVGGDGKDLGGMGGNSVLCSAGGPLSRSLILPVDSASNPASMLDGSSSSSSKSVFLHVDYIYI